MASENEHLFHKNKQGGTFQENKNYATSGTNVFNISN